mgnify:CR=1 FL=1
MKMRFIVIFVTLICSGISFSGTINHIDRISVGEFEEVISNSPLYKHIKLLKGQSKSDALLAMEVLKVELLYKINESNRPLAGITAKKGRVLKFDK